MRKIMKKKFSTKKRVLGKFDYIDQYLDFADLIGTEEALLALLKGSSGDELEQIVPLIFRDYEYNPEGEEDEEEEDFFS